jgi:hypothetical protein
MIELMLIGVMVACLWIVGSVVGLVLKVAFGLVHGVFSLLAGGIGLLIGGLVMLLVLPIVALSLLPLCVPALLLFGVIWLIAHAVRRSPATPAAH